MELDFAHLRHQFSLARECRPKVSENNVGVSHDSGMNRQPPNKATLCRRNDFPSGYIHSVHRALIKWVTDEGTLRHDGTGPFAESDKCAFKREQWFTQGVLSAFQGISQIRIHLLLRVSKLPMVKNGVFQIEIDLCGQS